MGSLSKERFFWQSSV